MRLSHRGFLALFLTALVGVLGGLAVAKGGFYVGKHEGDTLHLVEMLIRMADGEWPSLDFQTPIGVLAIAPIAALVKLGMGAGQAIVTAQALVAALLLPAVWWVSVSRFQGVWAYVFGAGALILSLALVHGEAQQAVSISMHYNRWAWTLSYIAIATAVLPNIGRARPHLDGVLIGLALALLGLIKVTYFVAFAPPILVALLGRRNWRALAAAVGAGFAVMLGATVMIGTPAYWLAYLHDLAVVAGSDVRPKAGISFGEVVAAPAYLGGSLLLLAGVVFLRQAGRRLEGVLLLVLAPGFIYVTYQNYGNDPQWLGLFALLMVALRPAGGVTNSAGWDLRQALSAVAIASFAFATPSAVNLAFSPVRHFNLKPEKFTLLVPRREELRDLYVYRVRNLSVDAKMAIDGPQSPYADFVDPIAKKATLEWNGETFAACETGPSVSEFEAVTADLKASGLTEGKHVFVADVLASHWLYGAFEPLPHGAPWYYGGLPGVEAADFLLVPLCPILMPVRAIVLKAVSAAGTPLTEVRRNAMYVLYATQ